MEDSGFRKYQVDFDNPNFETQYRTDRTTNPDNHLIQVHITGFDYNTHKGTAKADCYRCGKVFVENAEAEVTTNVTKEATETENGEIVHTVSYTYNGVTESHDFKEAVPSTNSVAVVENNTYWDEKGVTGYNDLTEALNSANGDTPVVLCKDVHIDYYNNADHRGDQVIDLNGHTLTVDNLTASSSLTVRNGTLNCVFSDGGCNTLTLDNAALNLTDSTWESANLIVKNGSTLNINGYFYMFGYAYPNDGFNLDIDSTSKVVFNNISISTDNMAPEYSDLKSIIEGHLPEGYSVAYDEDTCTYFIADSNGQRAETVELHKPLTVTWRNYDGSELEQDNVKYGTMPSYDGEIPSRPNTAQYTYTFRGWDKTHSPVTEDVTYSAVFEETVNKYTVTWIKPDGTTTQTLDYGTALSSGLEIPANYNSLWWYDENGNRYPDGELPELTGDVTYKAVFMEVKTMQVGTKFQKGDFVDFGTNYINRDDYTGWVCSDNSYQGIVEIGTYQNYSCGQYGIHDTNDSLIAWITSEYYGDDADITVQVTSGDGSYESPFEFDILIPDTKHTVTWKNSDGSVIKTDTDVPYGAKAVCDLQSVPENKMLFWSDGEHTYLPQNMPTVKGDVTYTAVLADIKTLKAGTVFRTGDKLGCGGSYIISDDEYNSIEQKNDIVIIGDMIYHSVWNQYTIDEKGGYILSYVHADKDYGENVAARVTGGDGTAENPFSFEILPIFTVTFDTDGGSTAESQEVYGTITQPETPVKDGYTFAYWYTDDNEQFDFNTAVTENITLTAKWYQNITINETDINGITTPNIVNRETFEEYSVPNAPYLDGYEFEGWTVNDTLYTQAETVKSVVESLVSTDTEIAVAVSYKKLEKTHTVSSKCGRIPRPLRSGRNAASPFQY